LKQFGGEEADSHKLFQPFWGLSRSFPGSKYFFSVSTVDIPEKMVSCIGQTMFISLLPFWSLNILSNIEKRCPCMSFVVNQTPRLFGYVQETDPSMPTTNF